MSEPEKKPGEERPLAYVMIKCFCKNEMTATVFADEKYELHCLRCGAIHRGEPKP